MEKNVAAFQCLITYRFFFFTNLQRFLDVCVIWRWVQICVCRRGEGESCWRNRSRKPFLLSPLHSSRGRRDLVGEGWPCSPAVKGQFWEEWQGLLYSRDSSCSNVGAGAGRDELVPCRHLPDCAIFSCNAICHFQQCDGVLGSEIKREKLDELTNTNINLVQKEFCVKFSRMNILVLI